MGFEANVKYCASETNLLVKNLRRYYRDVEFMNLSLITFQEHLKLLENDHFSLKIDHTLLGLGF